MSEALEFVPTTQRTAPETSTATGCETRAGTVRVTERGAVTRSVCVAPPDRHEARGRERPHKTKETSDRHLGFVALLLNGGSVCVDPLGLSLMLGQLWNVLLGSPLPPPHGLDYLLRRDVIQVAGRCGDRGVPELPADDADVHPLGP